MLLLPSPIRGWPKTNDWGSGPPPTPYEVIGSSSSRPDRNNIDVDCHPHGENLFVGRSATPPSAWITAEVWGFLRNFLKDKLLKWLYRNGHKNEKKKKLATDDCLKRAFSCCTFFVVKTFIRPPCNCSIDVCLARTMCDQHNIIVILIWPVHKHIYIYEYI